MCANCSVMSISLRQTSLSIGFSRQEHWSRWPFPSPGDLPDPRIELRSLLSPALTSEETLSLLSHWGSPRARSPYPTSHLICFSWVPSVSDFPGGSDSKASVYNVRDLGSIPGLGRFPGEGNGDPLQYSCLENPMDRGAWCRLLSMGSQRVGHD